jgi:hypothetical protein
MKFIGKQSQKRNANNCNGKNLLHLSNKYRNESIEWKL